jgi:hypothetical protein
MRARTLRRRYGRASKRRFGPVGLRYVIEPSRFGHVVVAYTNAGTRMPLATYPTHAAAVAGVAANRRAMQGGA